jgi:hypothetical protein
VALDKFRRAAQFIAAEGCHIVVQVLRETGGVDYVHEVLQDVFGAEKAARSDVVEIAPLPYGRGRDVFRITRRYRLDELAPCGLTLAPTIRYDGLLAACCNESVVMGNGPGLLRRRVRDRDGVRRALAEFWSDPLLRTIATLRPAMLAGVPGLADLTTDGFESICAVCWRVCREMADNAATARTINAIADLLETEAAAC